MKSLLFVNGHLNTGGIEKTLVDYLKYIDYSQYSVELLLLEGTGDYINHIPKQVNVLVFDTRMAEGAFYKVLWNNLKKLNFRMIIYRIIIFVSSKWNIEYLKYLRKLLPTRKHYDCVISYRTGLCADIVAYAIFGEKRLCWWHNGEFNMNAHQKKRTYKVWEKYDKIVSVSQGCKDLLVREFPSFLDKIVVLHNILDVDLINKYANDTSESLFTSTIKIVSVGNLTKRKHFENAIIVANELVQRGITNFQWIIIGDGEEKANLQEIIEGFRINSYIKLVGKKVNPFPYIKEADFMVHTSYGEAHCTAILEAMALRTPCIVTETNIPQDFTIDGYNCYLVKQNIESLLNTILKVLGDSHNKDEIVDNAYNWVNERYIPPIIINKFNKLIQV